MNCIPLTSRRDGRGGFSHIHSRFIHGGALYVKELDNAHINSHKEIIKIFGDPKTQNWYDNIGAIFVEGEDIMHRSLKEENKNSILGPFLFVSYYDWNSRIEILEFETGNSYTVRLRDVWTIKAMEDEDRRLG